MPMESWTLGFLFFIRKCRNTVAKYFVEWRVPGLTEVCTNQRPKMPRKVVTTGFGEKMFCLVAITYTSPKVSVTVNKRVPSKKREGPRGFKFEICFKST